MLDRQFCLGILKLHSGGDAGCTGEKELALSELNPIEKKSKELLEKAILFEASDLHFIPIEKSYQLLFRRNQQMFDAGKIPHAFGDRIVTYFKFLSSLDITNKRNPQSGAFEMPFESLFYNFRVSTLSSVSKRESMVIRIAKPNVSVPIDEISLSASQAVQLREIVASRQGLVLLIGPTGSGKSTTMYALTKYCSNELARHVISLEDPVEVSQDYLLQVQVNEGAGLTYSAGLRAILRHSPDVILIGEIRDKETAKIAVEAALTGHLVISTIHAKDAIGAIYRLLDLDVTLEEINQVSRAYISQRLLLRKQVKHALGAVYEILETDDIQSLVVSIQNGQRPTIPHDLSLAYQIEHAVRE